MRTAIAGWEGAQTALFGRRLVRTADRRTAARMTQEEVAARMWTTKSVVSRLESGVRTTLSTIEKYALAVGALVEIRVRTRRWLSRYAESK
jgi:transcriptional regulator with XRE-family HTH domain